jgi:hypothetical protein
MSNGGIVRNEPLVKISKSQEGANIAEFGWNGPGGNLIELDGIHGEMTGLDYEA